MTIPSIPNPNTADAAPLVLFTDYQMFTGDDVSSEARFDYFLPRALDELQREMRRTFLYAQYTERCFLYPDGMTYPTATPFDTSQGVTAPSGESNGDVGIFQGDGLWVGWFIPLPSLPVWQGVVDPQTDVTYTGGWVGTSSPRYGGVFDLPSKVESIIIRTVFFKLNPAALKNMPGGVKSSSVGGVSLAGSLSSFMAADPELRRDISGWRKPQVHAWDAQTT